MTRLSVADGLGAMAPLVGGTVKKSLVGLYFGWKQKQLARTTTTSTTGAAGSAAEVDEPWLAAVPEGERAIWRTVIALKTWQRWMRRMREQSSRAQ